jgi:phage gp36-like protein
MYATLADFEPYIKPNNLTTMISGNPTVLDDAVANAESEIRTYLFQHYDTDVIFSQTGTSRHAYLLRVVINITMYLLHKRLPSAVVPEHIQNDYESSIDWLNRVASGKIAVDLPKKLEPDDTPYKRFRFGSNPRNQ